MTLSRKETAALLRLLERLYMEDQLDATLTATYERMKALRARGLEAQQPRAKGTRL